MGELSSELIVLIGSLRRVSSPRERLAILLRAWKQVRQLSRSERVLLARNLGVDGASELVETLSGREGVPADSFLKLLQKVRDSDPSELSGFVRRVRDRSRWAGLLRDGLDVVGSSEDTGPIPVVPSPADPEPAPKPLPAAVSPSAPPPEPPPRADSKEPEVAEASVPAFMRTPPPELLAPVARPRKPPTPAPMPAEPPARPESPPAPGPVAGAKLEAAPVPSPKPALAARLQATPYLIHRFRILREGLRSPAPGDTAAPRALLARFPEGWPRRRALQALRRAGLPVEELVTSLPPGERRWFRHGPPQRSS